MKIVTAFISDRGDKYLPGCLHSYADNECSGIVDGWTVIDDREHDLGMAGAVRAAWSWAVEQGADYLLHVEEDFRFAQPIPLAGMAAVLQRTPRLANVVLKRQPWSRAEKAAGGQIEVQPELYLDQDGFVEHAFLFSLNPCLIPRLTLELEWTSDHRGVERAITDACLAVGLTFAYYGKRSDKPRCEHVGGERGQGWRL